MRYALTMVGTLAVTGCAGSIESHPADGLPADGHRVPDIDSLEDHLLRAAKMLNPEGTLSSPGFMLCAASILNLTMGLAAGRHGGAGDSRASTLLRDCACVPQAGVRENWGDSYETCARDNVLATQRLLEMSVAAAEPKPMYTSSSPVDGDQTGCRGRRTCYPAPVRPMESRSRPANTFVDSTPQTTGFAQSPRDSSLCMALGSVRTWLTTGSPVPCSRGAES